MSDKTHQDSAREAMNAAAQIATTSEHEARGLIIAQLATSHAVMHLADAMLSVRDQLESINAKVRDRS